MTDTKEMIGRPDEPIKEDMLGINQYCDGLAEFIVRCDTPMTISIQGDWGSGKTTALNIIEEKIKGKADEHNKYIFIRFNTWMFCHRNKDGDLTFDLIRKIDNQLMESISEDVKGDFKEKFKILKGNLITIGKKVLNSFVADHSVEALGNDAEEVVDYILDLGDNRSISEKLECLKVGLEEKIKVSVEVQKEKGNTL